MSKKNIFGGLTILALLICVYFVGVRAFKLSERNTIEEVRPYRIDSISSRLKYEVMPERVYIYHTAFGPLFGSHNRYKVGDSVQIKIITIKK